MRILGTTALVLLAVAGCGSDGEQRLAERCTERLLNGVNAEAADDARSHVRRTYCEPFASRGWVYEDGALSIDAEH